ncbi:HEPN domain-containing protein [Candidatus Bathyarchaeota archaeon]|nr:HEPN domain-containing protein [Candidatus Bathyarchaeota archaeon]
MTNIEIAKSALKRSSRWLTNALRALEEERWDDVVYSSQMVVEHASKAVLIAFGVEYPKAHDISFVFKQISKKKNVPIWFLSMLNELASNISELAELRGLASYGYEKGLDVNYFKDYAPKAYEIAKKHYEACVKLLSELYNININNS